MVKLPGTAYIVTGRLQQRRRITEGEVGFLRSVTSRNIEEYLTLIAPGFVAEHFWRDGVTDKVYNSREELGAEIAACMRAEVEALFAEGVRYVQFVDDPALFRVPELAHIVGRRR